MQITIDVSTAKTPGEIAEIIRKTANTFAPSQVTAVTPAPKKAAKPVDDEDEIETVEDDEETESADVEETDDEESEISLKMVQKAFREYATEHGDAKALKILKTKFNAKSLKDLKPSQYAKAIQAVEV